jgi:hypothetical protein
MTDTQTLLQLAARCHRMARVCSTEGVARKFEALALDYEDHARRMDRRVAAVPWGTADPVRRERAEPEPDAPRLPTGTG